MDYEKEICKSVGGDEEKMIAKILKSLDTAFKLKIEKDRRNKNKKFINIWYYNEDASHPKNLQKEKTMFAEETSGTFFL